MKKCEATNHSGFHEWCVVQRARGVRLFRLRMYLQFKRREVKQRMCCKYGTEST